MNPFVAKAACEQCGVHLEYPAEMEGQTIDCPECKEPTILAPIATETDAPGPGPAAAVTAPEIIAHFSGPVTRTRVSVFYQLGLCVVALAMVLLPVLYVGLIGLAAWGVYLWTTHFAFMLSTGRSARVMILMVMLYITPLFAGIVLVFFMIKPLFARRPRSAQPLALNPASEPVLFAFIAKICDTVGAPFPMRIDLDCQLNASASFRRGLSSLFSNDLVLTIGLPLVAGLNVTQFAGVLAHEFGHFTQGFGMRLTYVIRTVNGWFARVVYERDAWDLMLEEWAETEDGRVAFVVGVARFAVWCSRLVLKLLMYLGHGIGCFMLRQMEFDADSYQIKVAGSEAFETTMRRFHVLGEVLGRTYKKMRVGWNVSRELPDSFTAYLMRTDAELRDDQRTQIEDTMGLEKTGLFDTHPSNGDRIRQARLAGEAGVFQLDLPATALFSNFEVPARHVTALHYSDDMGIPVGLAKLVPPRDVPSEISEAESEPAEEAHSAVPRLKLRLKKQ
jgi:Zn-dependent protease with chaperone function